jgi:hypothetical protein
MMKRETASGIFRAKARDEPISSERNAMKQQNISMHEDRSDPTTGMGEASRAKEITILLHR